MPPKPEPGTPSPTSETNNLPAVLQTLLKTLGVPCFGWLIAANWQPIGDYAKAYPWRVLGLLALYETGIFVQGFAAEVWKKLKDPLVDWCATQIKAAVIGQSHYEKDYRRHVFFHCRDFDVKGLSTQGIYALELKRVFVELSIVPYQADRGAHDPIPRELAEPNAIGRREIWEYLENSTSHFAIIGAPGCGKTTLLKHVAITLALTRRKKIAQSLPVLLYLRNHAKAIVENADVSLEDVILASEILKEQIEKPPQAWFQKKLRDGKCLVLFDGLDEVGDSTTRAKIVAWIERRIRTHANNLFFSHQGRLATRRIQFQPLRPFECFP